MTKKPYLITNEEGAEEIWSNFKLACESHGWDYSEVRKIQNRWQQQGKERWPMEIDGYLIRRVNVNEMMTDDPKAE